jgi:tetratricopeptide (TPR) repeat protein
MALLTGIIVATWQARRADQQRALAEKRFTDVRELANNVVFKYHDAIAALPGATAAREMLVTDALAYLDNLAQETAGDTALQKELGRAYLKMADVQGKMYSENIGDTGGALINYQKAIALLEPLPDDEARTFLIQAYDSLAFLTLRGGNHLESRQLVQKAVDINSQLPESVEREMRTVDLHIRFGDVNVPDGRYELRLEEHLKALPIAEKIWKSDPNNFEKTKMLTRVYQRIGTDYAVIGNQHEERSQLEMVGPAYERAAVYHEKSLDTALKMVTIDAHNTVSRRFLAVSYSNLAESTALNENFGRALELANKSHAMIEEIFNADQRNREAGFDLALSFELFAKIYGRQKIYPQYIKYAARSIEVFMRVFQLDPNNREASYKLGELHDSLAQVHRQNGNAERAAFHGRQSKIYGPR